MSDITISKKVITGDKAETPKDEKVTFKLTTKDADLTGVTYDDATVKAAADGKAVQEITFSGNDTEFKGLKDGTYTLEETVAPDGFKTVSTFSFKIENGKISNEKPIVVTTGEVEIDADGNLIVKDAPKKSIQINKTDITGEKELEGAKLELLDSTGKKIDEWTSEIGKTWTVEDLPAGTYTLRETVAPDGYTIATDTTFTIDENGDIDKSKTTAKVDKDDVILVEDSMSDIIISKTDMGGKDITTGNATYTLTAPEGVSLNGIIINDKVNDKDAQTITFTGNKVEIKGLKDGTYELKEQVAPDGYTVVESAFTFTVENGVITGSKAVTNGDVDVIASTSETEIVVKDDISTIKVSKSDLGGAEIKSGEAEYKLTSTSGKALEGVKINGTAITGEDVRTYEFKGNKVDIVGLKDGSYKLEETVAPAGFERVTSAFEFEIKSGKLIPGEAVTTGDSKITGDAETGEIKVMDDAKKPETTTVETTVTTEATAATTAETTAETTAQTTAETTAETTAATTAETTVETTAATTTEETTAETTTTEETTTTTATTTTEETTAETTVETTVLAEQETTAPAETTAAAVTDETTTAETDDHAEQTQTSESIPEFLDIDSDTDSTETAPESSDESSEFESESESVPESESESVSDSSSENSSESSSESSSASSSENSSSASSSSNASSSASSAASSKTATSEGSPKTSDGAGMIPAAVLTVSVLTAALAIVSRKRDDE